jgi:N-acetylneuraminic acid mutarotase
MTPHTPLLLALTVGVFALTSCNEAITEPDTAGALQADVPALAVASNSWTRKASVPTPRYFITLGLANNSLGQPVLYAFGGIDSEFRSSKVEAYNAATNTWTTKRQMPERLFETNGVGLIGGKLYLPGGKTDSGDGTEFSPSLWVYDPSSDTWSLKADLPRLVAGGITGVINGKLYVLTGECINCAHRITRRLYRYDPMTNTWDTSLPWCPQAHMMGAGGVINGKFYVAGGVGNEGQGTNQLHVYDPATNKWTAKASMPTAQSGMAGAVLHGKLFILGGFEAARTVLAYDPVRNTWATKAPMPTGRRFLAAARYTLNGNSQILAVGGLGTEASPAANEAYTP